MTPGHIEALWRWRAPRLTRRSLRLRARRCAAVERADERVAILMAELEETESGDLGPRA